MKRILILTLILAVASAVVAAPPRPGSGAGPGAQGGPRGEILSPAALAEFLGLSEAQIEQSKAIREEMRAAIAPIRTQLRGLREQIEAALDAGNAQQAGTLMLQARALREQRKAAHQSADAKFEAILTAEQKAKWDVYQEIAELRRERGPRE